jgi:hypothetical protein
MVAAGKAGCPYQLARELAPSVILDGYKKKTLRTSLEAHACSELKTKAFAWLSGITLRIMTTWPLTNGK